jgi:putative flippase GtrA
MRALWQKMPLPAQQAICYAFIGGLSFCSDFLFYAFLTRVVGVYYLLANITSFIFIGTLNFLANRRLTFKHRGIPEAKQYLKFFIVAGTGVLLNTSILGALVSFFNVYDLAAKGVAAFFVFFWNFGVNRFWTFKHQNPPLVTRQKLPYTAVND